MGRIFTFGCSFTQYAWPTWADIIAYDSNEEYHNYAIAGLGNVGIYHRIVEADLAHKFSPDDRIYILWSSWSREDRVKDDHWIGGGSVFNIHSEHYDKRYVKKYWDYNNDIVKNSTAFHSVNKMFKDNITWQAYSFDRFIDEEGHFAEDNTVVDFYKKTVFANYNIPRIYCETNPMVFNTIGDSHPDVSDHLEIAKRIYHDNDRYLKRSTINKFIQIQEDLVEVAKNETNFHKFYPKIIKTLETYHADVYGLMNIKSIGEDV